ncbi:uncharacterized protein BP01DRAFT_378109 [Aspergillus saccharolyticus JOP 1030-1]|uniref:Uncharacterized protein n=1 Tax=Aspergillus saccharolyticus JOP 1030-1 TaxID=1450539 RepID=A0A318YYM4_9EURO|nr:hypothetical protein BP01DRAFT_378109 [Aspergillus saccharolyticus JOP 1030-1]PYH40101.1 hypothetical protein BP01DRAFT_378109 [Aspergillus saccharolyticus JOP 1030-1]
MTLDIASVLSLIPRRPEQFDLLQQTLLYLVVIFYHTQYHAPSYHVFADRIRRVHLGPDRFLPSPLDVLSCLVWSVTTGAVLRPVVCVLTYLLQDPDFHRLSIYALDSFVYARAFIFFFCYTPFLRDVRGETIYALAIPLSAAFSIHESRVPGASLGFWVSQRSQIMIKLDERAKVSALEIYLVKGLRKLGYAGLPELRKVTLKRALKKPLVDDYIFTSEGSS